MGKTGQAAIPDRGFGSMRFFRLQTWDAWLNSHAMSTLLEIEAAVPSLSTEELTHLDAVVEATLRRRSATPVVTARDALDWWEKVERFSPEEGEAFARDIEAGRAATNLPSPDRWA